MQTALLMYSPHHGIPYFAISRYRADDYRRGHPNYVWLFNPWTGAQRPTAEIEADPWGLGIIPPDESPSPVRTLPDVLALHRLANDLLDPERFGHAVGREVRNQARRALGIEQRE